ncbi:MAG: hypothetical protein B1H06_06230 [Candidatus Cloacimonas sp. 4484_143]|nr:MAG: hypothetical protein B1H06_06230 [Candidatus Cloacimonas sp. 4484_143]RLC53417.1 MAG: hypothetical protein DRI23_00295 [Candidatus Cloacimonadota bacterium]
MNKNNKKYIAILAALIAIFIITQTNDKTEKIINFFDVDSVDIARIELSTISDTLTLAYKNNEWMITSPIEYQANKYQVENFFKKVLNVQTSSLPISESETSFATYELTDSMATCVKLYNAKDKLLAEALFGKMKGQPNTPARMKDSKKIYRLNESISYRLKTDVNNWREKEVTAIDKDAIEKISVLYGNEGYELTRTDSLWQYEDGTESISVDNDNKALTMIFSGLRKVNSNKFKDYEWDKYETKLATPDLEVGVNLLDGSSVYLRLAKDDEKNYIMQKDNMTDHLFTQHQNWVDRFTKKAEDFK